MGRKHRPKSGARFGVVVVPIFIRPGINSGDASAVAAALEAALNGAQICASVLDPSGNWDGIQPPGNITGPTWDDKDIANVRVFVGPKS